MSKSEPESEGTLTPAFVGRTSRRVLDVVVAATAEGEVMTAREIAEKSGILIGQMRAILRQLREKGLIHACDPISVDDRTFRYRASENVAERLELGDKIRAERPYAKGTVDPIAPELYAPMALKLAAIDRAVARWTATAYRERKAIRARGDDPNDSSNWSVYSLRISEQDVELRADEVGPYLIELGKEIQSPAFRAAQKLVDKGLVVVMKGDDPS